MDSIMVLKNSASLPRLGSPSIPPIPAAMSCALSACASLVAKNSSSEYRSRSRAMVESAASGSLDGTQLVTELLPRNINGVFCAMAMAVSLPSEPPSGAMARLSQPSLAAPVFAPPFSRTSCPSKCERSRYGLATACTTSASLLLKSRYSPGSEGCSPNMPSSFSAPFFLPGDGNASSPRTLR